VAIEWEKRENHSVSVDGQQYLIKAAVEYKKVEVCFQMSQTLKKGENFYVFGSTEELGKWDPKRSIPLIQNRDSTWRLVLPIAAPYTIEYKYLIKTSKSFLSDSLETVTLEDGANRTVFLDGQQKMVKTKDSERRVIHLKIEPPQDHKDIIKEKTREYADHVDKFEPHINLLNNLHLDKNEFEQTAAILKEKLTKFPSFSLGLNSFDYFHYQKTKICSIHFNVDDESSSLKKLKEYIKEIVPNYNIMDKSYLTVRNCQDQDIALKTERLDENWKKVNPKFKSFKIREIILCGFDWKTFALNCNSLTSY